VAPVSKGRAAADTAWAALAEPWRAALEEAWASWTAGSLGIGAVAVDGHGTIVSRGRNRILEQPTEAGVLAGTFLAHAEMNALAVVPFGQTRGLTIYTSLEPCLMCAATMVMVNIGAVFYAAPDPLFEGIHDALGAHSFCAGRLPVREGPLPGPVGMFARILPLTVLAFWEKTNDALEAHRRMAPSVVALASEIGAGGRLSDVVSAGGDVVDAMASVWNQLG
jgi:tRNA(adenine34) deaminase